MQKGIVQFFLIEKGYGYIRIVDSKEEIYVQTKYTIEAIKKGDLVRFKVCENKFGLYATQVQKIDHDF